MLVLFSTKSFFISLLLFIGCATTDTRKNLEPLPKGYKTIYPNSNNFTFYTKELKGQAYSSKNHYKNTITGLFFFFLIYNKDEDTYFSVKYCNKDRIYFNKAVLYGKNKTINLRIGKLNSKKYNNGLVCDISNNEVDNNKLLNIYNFYKTNQDIKIKFIGRDGKSYIVPVSEQHRKDLIELVDYYRMLTHKSE